MIYVSGYSFTCIRREWTEFIWLGQRREAVSFEHNNELYGSTKGVKFDCNSQFLKKYSVPLSCCIQNWNQRPSQYY